MPMTRTQQFRGRSPPDRDGALDELGEWLEDD